MNTNGNIFKPLVLKPKKSNVYRRPRQQISPTISRPQNGLHPLVETVAKKLKKYPSVRDYNKCGQHND